MKKHFMAAAIAIASMFVSSSVLMQANATPQSKAYVQQVDPTIIDITGTVNGVASFVGTFDVQRFIVRNGELFAVGTLAGTLTNPLTGIVRTISQVIQLPVTGATGTCDILNLDLGPLDLNLLGLRVQLSAIDLDITAESGPGQLLGNLLCAVAGLLDGGSPLSALLRNLNQILGQL
ncbi:hypothetical protein HRH25_11230 [Flavisolibacter sp. BT320]|nr:hypothetical protein [Flavisolibacter longurius]